MIVCPPPDVERPGRGDDPRSGPVSADLTAAGSSTPTIPPGAVSVGADTTAILRLVDGDPIHERDRELIVSAIVETGRAHRLHLVNPNVVRSRLAGSVHPRCVGPVYGALRHAKVIEPVGWTVSTDTGGRNVGKPLRLYRLAESVSDA